ncbi:MAG: thiamine pyrophosphate-binding protein [Desulfurococcales archaeon]|nr:thiamine pyrophosphate-binding protein [Desulfurococcales archaeon]
MKISIGDLLARTLIELGVEHVYGIIGTSVVDFYDKLYNYKDKLQIHTTRHEQAAVSAADAVYRVSKKPAAAIVHAGPGFLNSMVGLGIASKDRVPLILISGGVRRRLRGTDSWLEVDQASIADGISRSYQAIVDPKDAAEQIMNAVKSMYMPPMGPVIIEVAEDLWKVDTEVTQDFFGEIRSIGYSRGEAEDSDVRDVVDLLGEAEKPLILVSGEAVYPPGFKQEKLSLIAERFGAYIITSGNGRGACDESKNEYCLGRVGFGGGSLPADKALEETDALLVLGNEFDDISTYGYTLLPRGDILVASRDPWVKKRPRYYDVIETDPYALLSKLADASEGVKKNRSKWKGEIEGYRKEWISILKTSIEKETELVNPNLFFHLADQVVGRNRIITAGQGTHIVYTYNHMTVTKPGTYLAATNLGAMGYALPAALGACNADPSSEVIAVTGDGEIMMVIQELETIVRTGCKAKIIVVNDNSYRVLYLRQILQKQGRIIETLLGNPDFKMLAESFGLTAYSAGNNDEAREALRLLESDGPALIEIKVDKNEIPPLNLDYTLKMNAV